MLALGSGYCAKMKARQPAGNLQNRHRDRRPHQGRWHQLLRPQDLHSGLSCNLICPHQSRRDDCGGGGWWQRWRMLVVASSCSEMLFCACCNQKEVGWVVFGRRKRGGWRFAESVCKRTAWSDLIIRNYSVQSMKFRRFDFRELGGLPGRQRPG